MKDMHCHLLYGIDDGSKSIEESIEIIENASKQGITDIIITPHYIYNSNYICNNKDKTKLFNKLKREIKKKKIDINLYLGNEIYICNNLIELIKKKEVATLNKSRYILIEFPLNNMYSNSKELIFELVRNGYVPVLAHPERYKIFKTHPEYIKEYLELGVLLQCNYMSLYNRYGFISKRIIKKFLKERYVTFLGSDNHHDKDYHIKKLRKDLIKIVKDEKYIDDILYNNVDKIIKNDIIKPTKF